MSVTSKKRTYARIAQLYDLLDLPFEYLRYRKLRKLIFDGLSGGALLDAGIGTGRNIPYYPEDMKVTGIDICPQMLSRAMHRRDRLGTLVDLYGMNVLDLEFGDHTFDHIASTFMFCVLDDENQLPALKELKRVCRPNGQIHILEYSMSKDPFRAFIMRLWAPWVHFAYGASFDRQTEQYLEDAGLELVSKDYIHLDIIKLLRVQPKT
ncbi:MAG: class I SAM-dependent methyltransferase [Rhodospirillales bacterium]|jgi:ubiquinone/menaquinone biosynthesis C-methylase UbiE|nr:class I SAM-dependent methyltransferase [Rhodospirillales bacterium]